MFKPTNITTATTTVVRSIPGSLRSVQVNSPFGGTITLYDNASVASGNKIATIAANSSGSFKYDCVLTYGLVVVTAGSAGDITVMTSHDEPK